MLFSLPLSNDFVVDWKGESESWCSIGREEFLGKVRNFDDLANVFCNAHLCAIEHE